MDAATKTGADIAPREPTARDVTNGIIRLEIRGGPSREELANALGDPRGVTFEIDYPRDLVGDPIKLWGIVNAIECRVACGYFDQDKECEWIVHTVPDPGNREWLVAVVLNLESQRALTEVCAWMWDAFYQRSHPGQSGPGQLDGARSLYYNPSTRTGSFRVKIAESLLGGGGGLGGN